MRLPAGTTAPLPFRAMPSGKRSKQQRREGRTPPPVQSKGAPRRRQASPKVLIAVAAAIVIAGVGIGVGVALSGGGSSSTSGNVPTYGSLANGLPGAAEVYNLFKGIPQKGNVLGSPSAPVTMVEYIDLQCPFCQQFETQVMPDLVKNYVRPGKVKVEVRPLAFIGTDSIRGRNALDRRRPAEPRVRLRGDPLRQPAHGEHRLAERRDGRAGCREHPEAERPAAARRPQLLVGEEPRPRRTTRSGTSRRSTRRRRSSSARAAPRARRSRSRARPTSSPSSTRSTPRSRSSSFRTAICGVFAGGES